jgi:hypothetical protein
VEGSVIVASMTLPPGSVGAAYSQTLTATGGTPPYTWCVLNAQGQCDPTQASLPPGLSLNASTGVISGTPTIDAPPAQFTVEASDSETQPATGSNKFSITIFDIISKMLYANAYQPYSGNITAAGGIGPYSWQLTSGSLPPGLALGNCSSTKTPVCPISGTPTTLGSFPFTMQVTDGEKPVPAVITQTVTFVISPLLTNGALKGNYAFNLSGFTKGGQLVAMAGAFYANGDGTFKAVQNQQGMLCGATKPLSFTGCLDYNDGSGETGNNNPVPQFIVAAQSSYSIQPNGLGTMTLVTDAATYNFTIAVSANGSGSLILDSSTTSAVSGSGPLLSQSTSNWPLCGSNFALSSSGADSSSARFGAAGAFQFSSVTCVDAENGSIDINDGGLPATTTFSGAFNQFDPETGRGIAGLTIQGDRRFHAFYFVSSEDHKTNQLLMVSTDPLSANTPLTLWAGLQQSSPPKGWDNTALNSTAAVELNARDSQGAADVTAGLFTGQGGSGNNCQSKNFDPATFNFDENHGGTGNLAQSSTGTYCVDKATGRVTLTAFSTGPFTVAPVFYMVKSGQAYVLGMDNGVTSGTIEPQTGSPFSASSVTGTYVGGTIAPVTSDVTDAATWLSADGVSAFNGVQYTSGPGGPGGPNSFNYSYSVDATGRVTVQNSGTTVGVAYVISPTKFVLLPSSDANPALSVFTENSASGGGN